MGCVLVVMCVIVIQDTKDQHVSKSHVQVNYLVFLTCLILCTMGSYAFNVCRSVCKQLHCTSYSVCHKYKSEGGLSVIVKLHSYFIFRIHVVNKSTHFGNISILARFLLVIIYR